uniref:Uncharacterized protein n=1 Tax=Desertifilum tharense IPPAS B-1220 TaxID=1781255 RepID=A0ACD5GYU0_9CYAN
MFNLIEKTIQPLQLNYKILEAAYELYLKAPQSDYPEINLQELSRKTGTSILECRNAIVSANELRRFPNCALCA